MRAPLNNRDPVHQPAASLRLCAQKALLSSVGCLNKKSAAWVCKKEAIVCRPVCIPACYLIYCGLQYKVEVL